MLSDTDDVPNLNNLENYHSSFYSQLGSKFREKFQFENIAGIYFDKKKPNLYAVCKTYDESVPLVFLPEGIYLCVESKPEDVDLATERLKKIAKDSYHCNPSIVIQEVMIIGILKWQYLVQVYIGNSM
ncbi:MAG: hypothetical protein RR631_08960 [Erysipelothrix sp.]